MIARLFLFAFTLAPSVAFAEPSFAEKTNTARPALANPPSFEECDATDLGAFVGKRYDEALKVRAIDASGSRDARVLRPGEPADMRHGLQRVTIELDAQGKVISARCG